MSASRPIVIIGFMGAGKTTVAKALATVVGRKAIDLDQFITQETGKSPAEIIDAQGEVAFRQVESEALGKILASEGKVAIALGGGAWTMDYNRQLIADKDGLTIWLDVPFEVCWQRILAVGNDRPLARDERAARALYDARRTCYGSAQVTIAPKPQWTPEHLAAKLAHIVRKKLA